MILNRPAMTPTLRRPATILAIESSCDETACAITRENEVMANVVATQIATHQPFGGVVPELASREHLDSIDAVVHKAIEEANIDTDQLDAIAVTEGPGLVGALLIGVQYARAFSAALGLPLYGVHHLEGHLCSVYLAQRDSTKGNLFHLSPHLALLVSGGHTQLVDVRGPGNYAILGASRDDAVGEAFDKAAKMLGLGYPGGPAIDAMAQSGNPQAHSFPRAMLAPKTNLEFSFSGLKTAMHLHIQKHGQPESREALADLCASYQAAIVDVLVEKVRRALAKTGHSSLTVVGGVAANTALRAQLARLAEVAQLDYRAAGLRYCGDNAAMIAAAALRQFHADVEPRVDVHTSRALDQQAQPS